MASDLEKTMCSTTDGNELAPPALDLVLKHVINAEFILQCACNGYLDDVPEEVGESVAAALEGVCGAIESIKKAYEAYGSVLPPLERWYLNA